MTGRGCPGSADRRSNIRRNTPHCASKDIEDPGRGCRRAAAPIAGGQPGSFKRRVQSPRPKAAVDSPVFAGIMETKTNHPVGRRSRYGPGRIRGRMRRPSRPQHPGPAGGRKNIVDHRRVLRPWSFAGGIGRYMMPRNLAGGGGGRKRTWRRQAPWPGHWRTAQPKKILRTWRRGPREAYRGTRPDSSALYGRKRAGKKSGVAGRGAVAAGMQ